MQSQSRNLLRTFLTSGQISRTCDFHCCNLKSLLTISSSANAIKDLSHTRPSTTSTASTHGYSKSTRDGHDGANKSKKKSKHLSTLMKPTLSRLTPTDQVPGVGDDLVGSLSRKEIVNVLNDFYRRAEVKSLASQQGMDPKLFLDACSKFRRECATVSELPIDLHIKIKDISGGYGSVIDLFPYFLKFARKLYPHLECVEDLKHVSNLSQPANLYPYARSKQRKIIIHAGPTNSGKTYHAFQRFLNSKSGIYCGPLKMLAVEIAQKSNDSGLPCDLVTGEDRKLADPEGELDAAHVSCTVEMCDIMRPVEVAIIDEIQMIRDSQRGWAWLRAFLGINADEIHLCGESTVIDLIKGISLDTGDIVEVQSYKRLTPIEYMNSAIESLENIQDGDCIVCFNKQSIYYLCRELEKLNRQCAVIYGSLPPGTKLAQAAKFNDPNDPCKVLISTDAIGMGLNLNIRRVIFYTLSKVAESSNGLEKAVISPSQALQIAGRCGRYGTTHEEKGYVTTFHADDLQLMHDLLRRPILPIEKAGIHPAADQLELFGFYLPHASLSDLLDIFINLMTIDNEKYFLCQIDQFKQLSETIAHIPMPLRTRYVFCCAPIPTHSPFVTTMFLKYARRFSEGDAITVDWLKEQLAWPLKKPLSVNELSHLESVHDSLDLYCWLSYRFEDQFPDRPYVKDLQIMLDRTIQSGVDSITMLVPTGEDEFENYAQYWNVANVNYKSPNLNPRATS